MYKLITSPELELVSGISKGNTFIPIDEGNKDYQQFIQDVAEQGIGIVEGPDVVEPSYVELRIAEYPSREEQFDMMYWDKVNGTTAWEDTIQSVKDKYPKTITGGTTIASVPTWVQEAVDNWTYNKQLRDYVNAVAILESDPDEETRAAAQAIIDSTPNSIVDSINN
tara:strand:+ start:29 stop:529 length:501 start_codon:yes stop_codon:yes gene_type:complete